MKQLLIIAAVLATIFASTFIIIKATGIITVDDIKHALQVASEINPWYVALAAALLLFADLFIAIPTLTVSILAGYFAGFLLGALGATTGMMLAGICGYAICRFYGPGLLLKIYKDRNKLNEMQTIFTEHGSMVLLICRAMPILPEVSCCMAGANKMPFAKFLLFYSIATIPYAFIAAYSGSQSTLADPKPAILTAIGLSGVLWASWFIFLRKNYGKQAPET